MTATNIEWADAVWNPVRGCTRVSEGCRNCYAEAVAARFSGFLGATFNGFSERTKSGPRWTGKVELIMEQLAKPIHWRKPRRVFVNSMSDLFHERLPFLDISLVFKAMRIANQHQFLVLTKRPARMLEFCKAWGETLPNVWLGVSVEDQKTADERIPLLLTTPAAVRFVSYEPALGPVDFRLRRFIPSPCDKWPNSEYEVRSLIDWIIVGGESGSHARPFEIRFAYDTIRQCREADVACFVKQLGSAPVDASLHVSDDPSPLVDRKGGDMSEWPADLRVREFPR
jgi:protein gp37